MCAGDVLEAIELDELFDVDIARRVHPQVEVKGFVAQDGRKLPRSVILHVNRERGSRFGWEAGVLVPVFV